MEAFIKLNKTNKRNFHLASSNVSRTSFTSLLESIRQTDNAEDDDSNPQLNTPKEKFRPLNEQKLTNLKTKEHFSFPIKSSNQKSSSLGFTTSSGSFKHSPAQSIKKKQDKKSQKILIKNMEGGPNNVVNRVLQKLGKCFETQNSSKNSSMSQADLLKTSYVNKQKKVNQMPRKWGSECKDPLRKSFATSISSNFDSDSQSESVSESEKSTEKPLKGLGGVQNLVFDQKIEHNHGCHKQKNQISKIAQILLDSIESGDYEKRPTKNQSRVNENLRVGMLTSQFQIQRLRPIKQNVRQEDFSYMMTAHQQSRKLALGSENSGDEYKLERARKGRMGSQMIEYSKRSQRSSLTRSKNIYTMTANRGETMRQYTVAILEYCSHEIGLACYNNSTGEFHLCQLVQNMTYFRTLATVEIFSPIEIIYPFNFENTLLIKRLKDQFRQTLFKGVYRRLFDQQSGYKLYLKTANRQYLSSVNRFLAFSSFNALVLYLDQNSDQLLKHQALNVQWHKLDQLLIIEPDAITDLEIFYNYKTKKNKRCLIENFTCVTYGGTRMLRTNLMQPPSEQKIILQRQKLLQKLLQNPTLLEFLSKEFYTYKFYEPLTAKFIKTPKQQNFKSLKSYLSSILLLSKQCLSLQKLYQALEDRNAFELPIIQKLEQKLKHHKIKVLKRLIEDHFEENMLKNFDQMKNKKDKYIFLFKVQKIQDPLAAVTREGYREIIRTIEKYFEIVKEQTKQQMHLMYNEHRGYFFKVNEKTDLRKIVQAIEQNMVKISAGKGKSIYFSTQMLSSFNNRLKQTQKTLVMQSESLLRKIIEQIQMNIDILFEINQIISTIDMVMSFGGYVNRYSLLAKFQKPTLVKGVNTLNISNLKPVWTVDLKSNETATAQLDEMSLLNSGDEKVMVLQKSCNSINQISYIYSVAYTIILSQIGCFVPAQKVELRLFDTILSKLHIEQKTEFRLSRFQINMVKIQNIFDNCFVKNYGRSLILVDEIARGSQHEEEIALSLATVKELQKNNGLSILATSDRMLIQYMLFDNEFKNVNIVRTKHSEEQKRAIKEITEESMGIMRKRNFDSKFIELFQEIKIEPTYQKIAGRDQAQNKKSSIHSTDQ